MINEAKWAIQVLFGAGKDKTEDSSKRYEEFKRRVLRSVSSAKPRDFSDKQQGFYHICKKPAEVLEYFYILNPMPGEDILQDANVTIKRTNVVANKTGRIVKEVKG